MFQLHIDGAVARLVLERPEARNAIALDGWSRLADLAQQAVAEGACALILAGAEGGAFCAGADIKDFARFTNDPAACAQFREAIRDGLERLRSLPVPTIAVVEGAAYGAGVAVAMACDLRIAGRGARFAITPAKLAISYPQEDVHRLVTLVGAGQASRLLLSAEPIGAAEAARIGLVELLVETDPAAEAARLAAAMAANHAESLRVLKRGIARAASGARADGEQDRLFDMLMGGGALAARLADLQR